MKTRLSAALLGTALASAAQAQMADTPPAHSCPATPAPLPPSLAGWASPTALTAATGQAGLAPATLHPGQAADATLAPVTAVAFPLAPGHAPPAASYGGLFAFSVTRAGTYRVSLSGAPWIDVVEDDRALESTAHGHGPACSGVRKQVDFALAPGRHVLQVSGATAPTLRLMVVPVAP